MVELHSRLLIGEQRGKHAVEPLELVVQAIRQAVRAQKMENG